MFQCTKEEILNGFRESQTCGIGGKGHIYDILNINLGPGMIISYNAIKMFCVKWNNKGPANATEANSSKPDRMVMFTLTHAQILDQTKSGPVDFVDLKNLPPIRLNFFSYFNKAA